MGAREGAERVQCPKCQGEGAWYEADRQDVWLRCLCGLRKLVATTLEDLKIEHIDAEDTATLPRRGSKLYDCLATLVGLKEATTGEVTVQLNTRRPSKEQFSNSDVASQLTVLRYKGLVKVSEERKGVEGGSTWVPTPITLTLFKGVRYGASNWR